MAILNDLFGKGASLLAGGRTPPSQSTAARATNYHAHVPGSTTYTDAARKLSGYWHPPSQSADREISPTRERDIAESRDLSSTAPMVNGALQHKVNSTVGHGLKLSARPNRKQLGWTAAQARDVSEQIEHEFNEWAYSPRYENDARRMQDLGQQMRIADQQLILNGEILAISEWQPDVNTKYYTRIRMVDPDRLSTPHSDGNPIGIFTSELRDRVRDGIEINERGQFTHAWIRESHKNDYPVIRGTDLKHSWRRYRRYSVGNRLQVLHIFDAHRADQHRGRGGLLAGLCKMKMLDTFEESALRNAVLNATYAAVIESDASYIQAMQAIGLDNYSTEDYLAEKADYHQAANIRFDDTKVPHLMPGEKLHLLRTETPGYGFEQFETIFLRHFAAGLGLSYEEFARDYSKTNYSGARAALLDTWRHFRSDRHLIGQHFCRQVYGLWLEEALNRGRIIVPAGTPTFYEAQWAWMQSKWIGPGKGHIDPLKEIEATKLALELNLTTLEDACAETYGTDYREVIEQRQVERELIQAAGLALPLEKQTELELEADREDLRAERAAAQAEQAAQQQTESDEPDEDSND